MYPNMDRGEAVSTCCFCCLPRALHSCLVPVTHREASALP